MEEDIQKKSITQQEKEILEKLRQVETSVSQHIKKNNRELIETKYYGEFTMNSKKGPVTFTNVFITIEKNEQNEISYHFRWINEKTQKIEEKILIDEEGKLYTIPELMGILESEDIEEIMTENEQEQGRLKGISEKTTSKEQAEQSQQKEDKDKEQIEADFAEQGEEIEVGKHRKIKDDKIAEIMPEAFEEGKEYELVEDKKSHKDIIAVKENGKYKKNEKIETGEMTTKKIFSIGPDGELKESEIPDSLMTVSGEPNKEIAVTRDEFEDLHIQTVQVTPCESRIARTIQMENEGPERQERKEISDTFAQEGAEQLSDDIARKKKELEEVYGIKETNLEELRILDIEAVMQAEADKAKMSKEGFKQYVKKASGKTLYEKIDSAHEEIEQEYKGGKRPR